MTFLPDIISKNRNFKLLFLARVFTHFALVSLSVIIGWQIYTLTKSELLLGLIGLAEAVPAIICALVSGYVVDIATPQKIYKLCLGALTLNLLFLWAVGGHHLGLSDGITVALLFTGIFISGIARSFLMPSSYAILTQIVTRDDYSAANAWLNTGFQIAVIGGPLLAGLIYGWYGVAAAYVIPVSCMAAGFLCVINFEKLGTWDKPALGESALESIKAGWHFMLKTPILLAVMGVDMFAVLFGGAVAMLPAFADQILHVGPEGLGLLRTAPALGAILSALYFSLRPMKNFSLNRLLWVAGAFGVCMIGFGLSTSFFLSMFFLALSGLVDTVSVIIRSTLKQILTPQDMLGRVSAINSMFIISSNEIGAFESGLAARAMGLVPSVVFGGIMTLVVVFATAYFTPRLRREVIDKNYVVETKPA